MTDPRIIEYIRASRAKGESDQAIATLLKNAGWNDSAIYEAFGLASVGAIASAPVANNTPSTSTVKSEEKEVNSSYSVFMAIVLIVSLFILSNKIFTDIKALADNNITSLLIIQALFVLPFLLVAFLLNGSLKEDKERYRIISLPYFIVSGWLLLRLLVKVASHILDTNAALGVYIVLGMVIIILSGIVLFVNRYMKK